METISNMFARLATHITNAWKSFLKNMGLVLSVCYGGLWFALFNGFSIPIILIHSWFVSSIMTLLAWATVAMLCYMAGYVVVCVWDDIMEVLVNAAKTQPTT